MSDHVVLSASELVTINGAYPDGTTRSLCRDDIPDPVGHAATNPGAVPIEAADAPIRGLIISALTSFIEEHGEISGDPDDVMSAASAIWDTLGISTPIETPHELGGDSP